MVGSDLCGYVIIWDTICVASWTEGIGGRVGRREGSGRECRAERREGWRVRQRESGGGWSVRRRVGWRACREGKV